MVYSVFVVAAKGDRFGDYAACNPDPVTGIFGCENDHPAKPTPPTPPSCSDFFWLFDEDCLNGTRYATVKVDAGD